MLILDVLADRPTSTMTRDLLGPEHHAYPIIVGADQDRFAVQTPGDRVVVAIEVHPMRPADAGRFQVIDIEESAPQRSERGAFLVLENQGRDFACYLVLAAVGKAVTPHRALHAQVVESAEASPRKEARSGKTDPPLHERFVRRCARPRGEDREAAHASIFNEAAVQDRRASRATRHYRFHVVDRKSVV